MASGSCRQALPVFPRGGSFFASSIASNASVFWCPHRSPHVLSVTADPAPRSPGIDALDLSALSCRISILLTHEAHQDVLFTDGFRNLQMVVSGADILGPVQITTNVLWPPAQVKQRLNGLECLNALRSTGRLEPRFFPPEQRRGRLRWVLRALDGSLAGASHREIGAALFGKARVEHDWADPGDHLRDMVRRAVKRGHALMNGGYGRFLL